MKMSLRWLSVVLLLTAFSVPPLLADGNPNGPPPGGPDGNPNGPPPIVYHGPVI